MSQTFKSNVDRNPFLNLDRTEFIFDEFNNYTTAGLWTTVAGSSGTTAMATDGSSTIVCTTAATAHDIQGFRTTNKLFLPAVGIPHMCKARVIYASQATNNAGVAFGFMSTTTLSLTTTDPSASFSGAILYKLEGGTTWNLMTSNGSTKKIGQGTAPATDGTYDLEIQINDHDGTQCEVVGVVNGLQLTDSNNLPIKLMLPYASLAIQYLAGFVDAGSANVQTASFNYAGSAKLRVD